MRGDDFSKQKSFHELAMEERATLMTRKHFDKSDKLVPVDKTAGITTAKKPTGSGSFVYDSSWGFDHFKNETIKGKQSETKLRYQPPEPTPRGEVKIHRGLGIPKGDFAVQYQSATHEQFSEKPTVPQTRIVKRDFEEDVKNRVPKDHWMMNGGTDAAMGPGARANSKNNEEIPWKSVTKDQFPRKEAGGWIERRSGCAGAPRSDINRQTTYNIITGGPSYTNNAFERFDGQRDYRRHVQEDVNNAPF